MLDTHHKVIPFGKYKGERWTRLPLHYIRWLANEGSDQWSVMARSELERRGSIIPNGLDLSGHAIDRASKITDRWLKLGVHSWLQRHGEEALSVAAGATEVEYMGFKWVFAYGEHWPTLVTIIPHGGERKGKK